MCCWGADGVKLHEIRPPGDAVTALAIDAWGHLLVASMDRTVRVYELPADEEMEEWQLRTDEDASAERPTPEVVQSHHGHTDAVRSIVHVPEKQQYITASWDRTLRVWQARKPPSAFASATGAGGEGDAAGGHGAAGEGEEGEGEEEFVPYAVKHRGIPEPKWLAERLAKGPNASGGLGGIGRKEEGKGQKKKKGAEDEAMASRGAPATGLAARLGSLEEQLKIEHLNLGPPEAKPGAATDRRGARRGGAVARDRGACARRDESRARRERERATATRTRMHSCPCAGVGPAHEACCVSSCESFQCCCMCETHDVSRACRRLGCSLYVAGFVIVCAICISSHASHARVCARPRVPRLTSPPRGARDGGGAPRRGRARSRGFRISIFTLLSDDLVRVYTQFHATQTPRGRSSAARTTHTLATNTNKNTAHHQTQR